MNLDLKNCNIYFTKSGVYLLLFAIGLASSSHVTGSNILLLLDFLLFSLIVFNFVYLKRLKSYSIELNLMSQIEEDSGPPLEIKKKTILPLCGKLQLHWERFNQPVLTSVNILRFSDKWSLQGDSISLRGKYNLKHLDMEIKFPLPLFSLNGDFKIQSKLLVYPKDNGNIYPDHNCHNHITKNDNLFSHFRDYLAGDPVNLVSWKEYARTNELMTKVFEPVTTSSQSYSIVYTPDNEKEIFQKALKFFQFKINSGQSYRIISKNKTFVFNGQQANLNQLLLFLSNYQQPEKVAESNLVIGECNATHIK